MRDFKRRTLDINDGQILQTLYVNTPSNNYLLLEQSDPYSADEVNTVVSQATNGCMDRKAKSESNPEMMI